MFADSFLELALIFGVGFWITTRFYQVKGLNLSNLALLALLLALVAPIVGGIPSIGGGAGIDVVTGGAMALVLLWAGQSVLRVSMTTAAAYLVLAWVVGASLLHLF